MRSVELPQQHSGDDCSDLTDDDDPAAIAWELVGQIWCEKFDGTDDGTSWHGEKQTVQRGEAKASDEDWDESRH